MTTVEVIGCGDALRFSVDELHSTRPGGPLVETIPVIAADPGPAGPVPVVLIVFSTGSRVVAHRRDHFWRIRPVTLGGYDNAWTELGPLHDSRVPPYTDRVTLIGAVDWVTVHAGAMPWDALLAGLTGGTGADGGAALSVVEAAVVADDTHGGRIVHRLVIHPVTEPEVPAEVTQ